MSQDPAQQIESKRIPDKHVPLTEAMTETKDRNLADLAQAERTVPQESRKRPQESVSHRRGGGENVANEDRSPKRVTLQSASDPRPLSAGPTRGSLSKKTLKSKRQQARRKGKEIVEQEQARPAIADEQQREPIEQRDRILEMKLGDGEILYLRVSEKGGEPNWVKAEEWSRLNVERISLLEEFLGKGHGSNNRRAKRQRQKRSVSALVDVGKTVLARLVARQPTEELKC
jgi:hypothetical protein